jgi:hypothetical protein
MRKFIVLILLTLILAATVIAPAMAQDDVFCGELSADDCAILENSNSVMNGLTSATADLDIQIDVENIPDVPTININLSGTAAYSADMSALAALSSGEPLEGEAALDALLEAIGGFDGSLDLVLTVPQDFAATAGLPFSELNLELALVDGVGYINFDALDEAFGGLLAAQNLTGWGGINFVDLINQAIADDPTLLDQFTTGLSAGSTVDPAALAGIEGLADYITITREGDMDGAAVFTTNIDFGGAVSDPAFQDFIQQTIEASGQALSDSDFQQAIGLLQLVGNDVTLTSTQFIDPATGYLRSTEVNFSLDLTTLLAASGQTVDGDSIVSIVLTVDYSGQNETTVEAPAGATIATMEDLENMGN